MTDKVYSYDRDGYKEVRIKDGEGKAISPPGQVMEVEVTPQGGVVVKSVVRGALWGKTEHTTTLPSGTKVAVQK